MAAFLPPRNRNDMSYREDNGGGGVGKVRKNTFGRATRTKPYDRPPTSIRNPNTLSSNASGGDNNGWLSKLVDPAQRLITASAHKLFSSVFRKRLPPPPLQPPEPEANERTRDERRQADPTDHVNTQGTAVDGFDISSGSSDRGGITDLEQMFKQKTFTRSEIDRLTALLQSRSIDMSVGHEERRSEVIPSTAVRFQDRKGEFLNTPVKDSRIGTNLISTPIVSEDVLDEDVASPAELAKAYMGSRPSKVSPSVLGLRSQPPRENSSMPMNSSSLKSAIVPAFPRSSGRPGFIENGFLTPRSLSRSAIHSLARASQSRFQSPTTFQAIESVGGSTPASQIAWENNRSGSKQGSLKRRSSVLDNDIGSSDGIRRIRQKYNLLPGSGSLPIRRTGLASDATKHPSSTAKTNLEGEPSTVNGGNSFHGSGFTPVPTKSSEMASKIFQQLDALVKTSKEKSPAKLSPSMLHGSALKSLENVDSSMFMDNVPDNNLDVRRDASLADAMDSAPQKHGQSEENGPPNSIAYYDKPILEVGDKDAKSLVKNSLSNDKTTAMSTVNSALHAPAQKKRAFRMTAHEDFLDLDDDDDSNGNENTLAGGSEKLDPALAESKTSGAGPVTVENPPASTKVNPPSDSIWEQKTETLTFSKKPSPIATLAGTENKSTTVSDKDDSPKKSNDGVPISVLEDKLVSRKEPNGISPTFSFGAKMGNEAPQMIISSSSRVEDSSRINFSASSDSKPGNSSSISVAFGATESPLTAGPESQKRDSKNNLKADAFRLPETVPSAVSTPPPSIFQFGSSSSLNNGSVTPSFLSAAPPAATDSAKTTSTGNTTANNFSPASSTPSFVAATISSVFPSTSASPPSATAAVGLTEAKTKETSFGNLTGSSFGGTSLGMGAFGGNHFGASMSAVSNIFGGTTGTSSSSASTVSNIFGGTSDPSSTSASTVSNIFSGTSGPSSTSAGTGTNFFGSTSAMTTSDSSLFGTSSAMTTAGSSVFGGTTMSSESNIFGGTGSSNFGGTSSSVVSTGSGIFSFNTGAASSAASNQPQAFNPFSNGSAPALTAGSVSATSTQSIPIQFGSSASAPSSGLTGNTAFSSSSPPFFGASSSSTKPFNSGATFGLTPSTPSSEASALSSSSNNTSSVFGSSWQTPKSPVPNSTTSAPSVFAFGGSSASTTTSNTTPMVFGSSASNSSASFPPFSTPAVATPSQPVFGNSSPAFPFGNNGQMSMEESMAEDTVQTSTPSAPVVSVFNQQPMSSSFVFGASSTPAGGNQFGATPPAANPFQFGGQPNIATPQNASPFQASGSLDFNAGGSFSLGASGGGGDKSNRRIVKVRRAPRKK